MSAAKDVIGMVTLDPITMYMRSLVAFLLGTLLFSACKKEEHHVSYPQTTVPNPVRSILAANVEAATQSFTVNAVTGSAITASEGSRIMLYPGSFVSADGSPVTGMVDVKVIEVLTMADMVLLNKQTVGLQNGELRVLKSGGEIMIDASQNGQEVFIIPDGALIQIPAEIPDPLMRVFYGTEDADGDMVWNQRMDTITIVPVDSTTWDTTGTFNNYYQFPVDSLTWINCDYFYNEPSIPMALELPEQMNGANTMVWVMLPTLNAVMSAWNIGSGYTVSLPSGLPATVIALYEDEDGELFSSITELTSGTGPFPITFTPTTAEQFAVDVNGL